MHNDFIKHSYLLPEKNTWISLDGKMPTDSIPYKLCWLHMECDNEKTKEWMYEQDDIDEVIIEALLAEDTRPRTTIYPDGYLINLRGVNLDSEEDPHDMISIRMFVQNKRIISTSRKQLHAVDDLAALLKTEDAPETPGNIVAAVLDILADRAEIFIIELKESTYDLEYKIIDEADINQRRQITEIRRAVIKFSRFFSPQRDAALKLTTIKGSFFSVSDEQSIQESINKLNKFIEDLDSLDNRCYVLQDEVAAITNERINKKMYFISVMATVFLPLSFLTGLLGVNLGGIPGALDDMGFLKFILVLLAVLALQIILLVKSKKL